MMSMRNIMDKFLPSEEELDQLLANFKPEEDLPLNQPGTKVLFDVVRPVFKTDSVGSLINQFRVIKEALHGRNTAEIRNELKPYIDSLITKAATELIGSTGLKRNIVTRLESVGIAVSLLNVKKHQMLVLASEGVAFNVCIKLREFKHIA